MLLWDSLLVGLYLKYDTDKEYLPQLQENVEDLSGLLDQLEAALAEAKNGTKG